MPWTLQKLPTEPRTWIARYGPENENHERFDPFTLVCTIIDMRDGIAVVHGAVAVGEGHIPEHHGLMDLLLGEGITEIRFSRILRFKIKELRNDTRRKSNIAN